MAGALLPLPFQNGAMEAVVPFIIGAGAGKFGGVRRIFARISPNLPKRFLCNFAYKLSPTKIMKTFFWYDL